MCLIAFAYRSHPEYELILVANRDEFFARPTRSAHRWESHSGIVAGLDLEQGGTWLGVTEKGRFTAVTNFRDGRNRQTGLQSRGFLTRDYLTGSSSAGDYMLDLEPRAANYGGFNLLCGDDQGLYYLSNSGGGMQKLDKGVFGLSNAHLNTPWPKVKKAREELKRRLESGALDINDLQAVLQDPQTAPDEELPDTGIDLLWEKQLSSQFIRIDGYGTRCTTVVLKKYNGELLFHEQEFTEIGAGASYLQEFRTHAIADSL